MDGTEEGFSRLSYLHRWKWTVSEDIEVTVSRNRWPLNILLESINFPAAGEWSADGTRPVSECLRRSAHHPPFLRDASVPQPNIRTAIHYRAGLIPTRSMSQRKAARAPASRTPTRP